MVSEEQQAADERQDARQDERQDASQYAERTVERRRGDSRMLVIFLVVVAAFIAQSVRIEAQQHSIEATNHQITRQAYRDCQVRNQSAADLNTVLDTITVSVRTNPLLSAAEKAQRVATYQGAKQGIVNCGRRP